MTETNNKEETSFPWGLVIFLGIIFAVIALVFVVIIYEAVTSETIVVEGTIVSAEYIENDGFMYDVLRVTFDNNETYDLVMDKDYDFTVSSRLILKLEGHSSSNRWVIQRIVKVPDAVVEEV